MSKCLSGSRRASVGLKHHVKDISCRSSVCSGPNQRQPILQKPLRYSATLRGRRLKMTTCAAPQATAYQTHELDGGHLLTGPQVDHATDQSSHALIILLPGAFLEADDYRPLLHALQVRASSAALSLWVAACYFGWNKHNWQDKDMPKHATATTVAMVDAVKQAAVAQGFPMQALNSGRAENVFIMAHSAGSFFCMDLTLKTTGGLILLGAPIPPSADLSANLLEWGRPVLHIGGCLDGQLRATKMAPVALQAAQCAAKFGPRYAAAFKPFVLLPHLNHGGMSNGKLIKTPERADMLAECSLEEGHASIADTAVTFLTAHLAPEQIDRNSAIAALEEACKSTAQHISPFTSALGRGSVLDMWQVRSGGREAAAAGPGAYALLPGNVIAWATGTEAYAETEGTRHFAAHPGELAALESFAQAAQQRIIQVAEGACGDRPVLVNVHTDIQQFTNNQPLITPDYIMVHAMLYRTLVASKPVSPHYFLKLKSAEGLRQAAGLETGSWQSEGVTAQLLHEEMYEAALASVTPEARALFEKRGKAWDCQPDRDVVKNIKSPVQWIQDLQVELVDTPAKKTQVSSPVIKVPVSGQGNPRFQGSLYLKVLSPAAAVEWVLVEGLRESSAKQ